ncbi:MAG: hypothetical protein ACQERV_04130 [Bacteroidota bacterium]
MILLLPVSHHRRLLAGEKKTVGMVAGFKPYSREIGEGKMALEYACEIRYNIGDTTYLTYGSRDLEYRKGRNFPVLSEPDNPSKKLVLTISAVYLNIHSGISLILLILWSAFYLFSLNRYSKRKRKGGTKNLASSPYKPFVKRSSGLVTVLAVVFQLIPIFHHHAFSNTIRMEPAMGDETINRILGEAQPGDTILFTPGTYRGPFLLEEVHGNPDLPVVILGSVPAAVIDGQTKPGTGLDNQAFRLSDCSWIVIEGFTIRNCWTDLVRADNVSYLSLRNCLMKGGKRAVFATGRGSHHFLVEGCTWDQDERLWTHEEGYSWDEIHHGIHSHYNGSLFQGYGISGVFVIRDNIVRNTFNAFRVSLIGDRGPDPLAGTNGEIYRNTVFNTSDNVLEPEVHALNLHFYHNNMINGHAFISITEVAGGEIYIYGNTALTIPGDETGWTIFKISSRHTALTRPLYIFNNSWWVNFDMVGRPRNIWENDHVKHFNNACFSAVSDSFGIYNLGEDNYFDYDCSNVPFPAILTRNGHERHGIVADPGFRDPLEGDFSLVEGSPCIDQGMEQPELLPFMDGDTPDIGAYDNGLPVEGPPFRFVPPEVPAPFQEMPRITRFKMNGSLLRLWFSAPLSESSVRSASFRLVGQDDVIERGQDDVIELEAELSGDGYCLTLSSRSNLPAGEPSAIVKLGPEPESPDSAGPPDDRGHSVTNKLVDFPEGYYLQIKNRPESTDAMPMTGWASVIPVQLGKSHQSESR